MAVAHWCLRWREVKIVTSLPAWLWTIVELGALAITVLSGRYVAPFLCSLFDAWRPILFRVLRGRLRFLSGFRAIDRRPVVRTGTRIEASFGRLAGNTG